MPTKLVKVNLTENRSETVEIPADISAEAWLAAVMRDGLKTVELNRTVYPKAEVVGVEDVKRRSGSTNMEGI